MDLIGCVLTRRPLCVRARPLWLSPAQVMVIPVGGDSESYSKQVSKTWALFLFPVRDLAQVLV